MNNTWVKLKRNNKVSDLNLTMTIFTLHVKGLNHESASYIQWAKYSSSSFFIKFHFIETQPRPFTLVLSVLLSCCNSRLVWFQQRLYNPKSLTFFLSGILQKTFVDPLSKHSNLKARDSQIGLQVTTKCDLQETHFK